MRSYFDAMLRYFEFSGRTGRAQYWIYQFISLLVIGGTLFIEFKLNHTLPDPENPATLVSVVALFHAIPGLTVTVRRLHDIGKSGWWYLLNFVPFGGLFILVWTCYASQDGANDFGEPSHFTQAPATPRRGSVSNARLHAAMGRTPAGRKTPASEPGEGRFI
ncbi:DUF805 domain-containing protein [Devosia sp.]|uniref:DUF805 domain-containing protein n=1 Tax=Devosia sp. TaxID=1871048 RepID=UPI0032631246